MRALPPLTITPAMLTSTTADEPAADETAWNSGTAYTVGQQAISTTTHRVYECIQAHTNKDPTSTANAAYWTDIGATNRWRMFDLLRATGTSQVTPLTVVITPGVRVDSLALIGLDAEAVSVTVTVSGSPVYTYTEDLRKRDVTTWYEWFTWPFETKDYVAIFNLPPFTGAVITISLTKAAGAVNCGGVVLGTSVYLGTTIYSPENDSLNFSKIDRDTYGTAVLIPRRTVPKTLQNVRVAKADITKVLKLRDTLNAVPALWSGLDDQDHAYFSPLLILGVYKRFTLTMDQINSALLALELEEV